MVYRNIFSFSNKFSAIIFENMITFRLFLTCIILKCISADNLINTTNLSGLSEKDGSKLMKMATVDVRKRDTNTGK